MLGPDSRLRSAEAKVRQRWTEILKRWIRPAMFRALTSRPDFHCPICGYRGPFKDKRVVKSPLRLRLHSKCPSCTSAERHRLIHLVLEEFFGHWSPTGKSVLHIAPEECLRSLLSARFQTYHTSDLFRKDVDFQEDLQNLSFPDASYDAVLVSRVLTVPPNLPACLDEIRRILKPGGVAVIAEAYTLSRTDEFGEWRNERSRIIGLDLIEEISSRFQKLEHYFSRSFARDYQLDNLIQEAGVQFDDYQELVRIPGEGFQDLVVVAHA